MMKMRILFSGLITGALLATGTAVVAADAPRLKAPALKHDGPALKPGKVAKLPANPCPKGWELSSPVQNDGSFMCEPMRVRPVDCPPKTQWVTNGCAVGCQTIIY